MEIRKVQIGFYVWNLFLEAETEFLKSFQDSQAIAAISPLRGKQGKRHINLVTY